MESDNNGAGNVREYNPNGNDLGIKINSNTNGPWVFG
jgi:hypothetical protein